jgi:hypothetical protein
VSPEKLIEACYLFDHCVAETKLKIKKVQNIPHSTTHNTSHNEFKNEVCKDLILGEF